ncbi:glycoside hydrolase family 3 protein [bacterium]|nr:glycoside hydrolase family 3 protein [bacterium]MBQ9246006.1 glycoside hydrolase family 3 protein [bacterium]MBQ9246891.1 glycoside hydrolase family 3 protein [bacterium]
MAELKEKLYQMFILGLEGGNYETALQKGLGGVIFFSKDILSAEQFKNLIKHIKQLSKSIPPFLSIDQEGGRVERTENIHNGKKYLSAKYAFERGKCFLSEQTNEIARELKSYGINLNFAPCIDVNTNPNNPIIGERAFSSNPNEVVDGEKVVSNVYRNNGIIPCVKHFPGHGDANADSHLTLPEINLSVEEMEKTHILPFKSAIENGADMIMAAHLHCSCFEKDKIPTSLSKNAISYLRNKLNFGGVIISDDMVMKGVAEFGPVQACEMAIRAGLNMFIYRFSDKETIDVIEKIYKKALSDIELRNNIENSYDKIVALKKKYFGEFLNEN